MDVKVSPYIIFFVCVTLGLQNASAKFKEMTLKAENGDMTCSTKYTTCNLSFDGKPVLERGEKGDSGSPGLNGNPGLTGEKGDQGRPGLNGVPGAQGQKGDSGRDGLPGMMGAKGDAGENGTRGPQGPSGIKGERGQLGLNGLPGTPGMKGEPGINGRVGPEGQRGLPGPVGPPGAPGSHGVCPCHDTPNTVEFYEPHPEFGTLELPAEIPCKSAPLGMPNGYHYLGPIGKPIKVFCNMTSLETCIRTSKKTPECKNRDPSKGAFWLTEMGVDMKELYYDISNEQITWLRDRSESVRQTLKYNCLDSIPYNTHNMSLSVKLWGWNDMVIGPYPTDQSPIFYSVPEATDGCKDGIADWKSTIIELQSSNVYRLPIVNMWIGDIRNAGQKMSIESVELCFG